VSKANLGNKHICAGCDARFFDLKKTPAVCPKCGEKVKPAKPPRSRRASAPEEVAPKAAKPPLDDKLKAALADNGDDIDLIVKDVVVADSDDDDDDDLLDDDDEDDLIEDTSDLSEEDDDVQEVLEHVDEGTTDKV